MGTTTQIGLMETRNIASAGFGSGAIDPNLETSCLPALGLGTC